MFESTELDSGSGTATLSNAVVASSGDDDTSVSVSVASLKSKLQSITNELYEDLVHYFKYASSAYTAVCPRPNGKRLVMPVVNPLTDVQGYVARDDQRREVIVALRGSASVIDAMIDSQIVLVPFISPGVELPDDLRVHTGFLLAWDSIAHEVIALVKRQLKQHEGYSIVTCGHSLGGSLALLAAVTLQQNFKTTRTRTYSYGSPRTGNKIFADYVNATFGENAYRVVHGNDGVPTMIPRQLGYYHHGIEYWQYTNPPSEDTTAKCLPDGEDPNCSACIKPSRGVTPAHTMYFGILATMPFCF